jgi:hypothetical protein
MYENGKMKPAEMIPGMGGRAIKENDGGIEFNYDILRTLVNFTVYPQYNNNKIKFKNLLTYMSLLKH